MKRQLIIDAMKARFKTITPAAGYYTDFSNGVHAWQGDTLEEKQLPAIIVRDLKDNIGWQDVAGPNNRYMHKLTVEISIVARTNDTGIRKMMADVYKSIGTDDTWSGNAVTSDAVDDEIVVQQESYAIQGAVLTIEVQYITNRFQED